MDDDAPTPFNHSQRVKLARLEWGFEALREDVREAVADVKALDAKVDQVLQQLAEMRGSRPDNALSPKKTAGIAAGLSGFVAILAEVISHLVK